MIEQKGDTLVCHIAQTTVGTMSPQDQHRQNCAGEEFLLGTIITKKKGDWFYWVGSIVLILAVITSPHWAHFVAR